MISTEQYHAYRARADAVLESAGFALTPEEASRIEVADFGLGDLSRYGLQLIIYVNTERVCAKELILFPGQVCPEHRHPPFEDQPGKEETFRCRQGEVYLYVPGQPSDSPAIAVPHDEERHFTARREIHLRPGDQYTIAPDTAHWFAAGPAGAIVSEFSTRSADQYDIFADPRVVRAPRVVG